MASEAEPDNISPELSEREAGILAYMEKHRLPAAFYRNPTLEVARQLLGKALVCKRPEGVTAGIIVETEGYVGHDDPASHAYVGQTARNGVMWGEAGHAYIYFTYGNHWMFNAVTEQAGFPAAVLCRALQPLLGLELMQQRRRLYMLKGKNSDRNLANGPGKLCQALGITGELNGQPLQDEQLFIADLPEACRLPSFEIVESARIGITRGVELPWRYYVAGNQHVSRF